MEYRVVITSDAKADLEGFIRYLLYEKQNEQAASNLLDDKIQSINPYLCQYIKIKT